MNDTKEFSYDFMAPRQIVFGWGRRREVGQLAASLGQRALIVCGSRALQAQGTVDEIVTLLKAAGVDSVITETISHEPEVDDVDRLAAEIRDRGVAPGDIVLALGGGAAIDLAKAVAAMATNDESPTIRDYLEGVGRGLKLVRDPLPILAMPTTAGTGTEATKNAVISSYDPQFKKSIRDQRLVPSVALIDPELTVSVPMEITAASGMDAVTQLIESYISRKAKPIPQALAAHGLKLAIPAVAEVVEDGNRRDAREKMAHAALLSGMALANSGLGMAHGVAAALGVHLRVPHGAACALMLPIALRVNRQESQSQLARLAFLLYGKESSTSPDEAAEVFVREIEALCDRVGVPRRLRQVGVTPEHIPELVKASRGSSMSGNPSELSDDELAAVLEANL